MSFLCRQVMKGGMEIRHAGDRGDKDKRHHVKYTSRVFYVGAQALLSRSVISVLVAMSLPKLQVSFVFVRFTSFRGIGST